jgi:hypothetical protein
MVTFKPHKWLSCMVIRTQTRLKFEAAACVLVVIDAAVLCSASEARRATQQTSRHSMAQHQSGHTGRTCCQRPAGSAVTSGRSSCGRRRWRTCLRTRLRTRQLNCAQCAQMHGTRRARRQRWRTMQIWLALSLRRGVRRGIGAQILSTASSLRQPVVELPAHVCVQCTARWWLALKFIALQRGAAFGLALVQSAALPADHRTRTVAAVQKGEQELARPGSLTLASCG